MIEMYDLQDIQLNDQIKSIKLNLGTYCSSEIKFLDSLSEYIATSKTNHNLILNKLHSLQNQIDKMYENIDLLQTKQNTQELAIQQLKKDQDDFQQQLTIIQTQLTKKKKFPFFG